MTKMGLPLKKTDRTYTYGDYRTWPDDERWELIEGIAWNMSPAPSTSHQGLNAELVRRILNHVVEGPCRVFPAPFDVLLPGDGETDEDRVTNVVQPDVTVVCDPSKLNQRGCLGAPNWVIEVLSPHTALKDLNEKKALYERSGVPEYWLFDIGNRCLYVYRMGAVGRYEDAEVFLEDATAAPRLCDGPVMPLSELWQAARIE